MTEQLFEKDTIAGCINSALFWLEGTFDDVPRTDGEYVILINNAIADLQTAASKLITRSTYGTQS